MNRIIKTFSTPNALSDLLALELANQIRNAKRSSTAFTIALSGGSTPKLLFSTLGDNYAGSVDWSKVHFFWVDERCVPPGDPESNYGMTSKALLSKIDIPEGNIHRIKGEEEPFSEALRYSEEINKFVGHRKELPSFNIMFLGLGEDGHTASIFPGNIALFQAEKTCDVAVHPQTGQKRITLTGKVINNSESIIFIVTGSNKDNVVNEILGRRTSMKRYPAEYVIPTDGTITWYLDEAAASLLQKR